MVIKMKAIETALSLTQAYKLGIERFEKMLGDEFSKAIELMNKTNEHIIICGMGKSGLVGRKISSTLASTGTPSIFLHPAEAIHGDLGKVQKKSIVLLISYSGETGEIIALMFTRTDFSFKHCWEELIYYGCELVKVFDDSICSIHFICVLKLVNIISR